MKESTSKSSAMNYGRCFQQISLEMNSAAQNASDIVIPNDIPGKASSVEMDLNLFNASIAFTMTTENTPKLSLESGNIQDLKGKNLLSTSDTSLELLTLLLRDDKVAIDLALKHDAPIIITADGLSALLQRPGNRLCRWKLPFKIIETSSLQKSSANKRSHVRQLIIFEDALPIPLYPRECLSQGFKKPVRNLLLKSIGTDENKQVHCTYHVITLSTIGINPSSIKVVVRTCVDLIDEKLHPVFNFVQLEYFPENREVQSCDDRASWMLHKIMEPNSFIFVFRVDPNSCSIIDIEEKSIAHIIASNDSAFDPKCHFGAAAGLFKGIESSSLPHGQYLVCCHQNDSSVSVHKSIDGISESNVIDLDLEFDNAVSVFTNEQALLDCFRMWEWPSTNQANIPYTFPLDLEKEETDADKK